MTDLSLTIAPKSDQLNADDLIAGPRTITITHVSAAPSSPDQPIAINFEGDRGKPYKPCKSMRRVFVQVWGKDGHAYVGRSLTLYRDPAVQFGGIAVGGIRISHMSHIDQPVTMALTTTRANRKPYTVKPLANAPAAGAGRAKAEAWAEGYIANPVDNEGNRRALSKLQREFPDLHETVRMRLAERASAPAQQPQDDGWPTTGSDLSPLAEAKAKIENATSDREVDAIMAEYQPQLSETDFDALRSASTAKLAEMVA